jgi:thioredoxin reductase
MDAARFDVAIVGGGAAGLSAALILARARRSVSVCDEGNQRNRKTLAMHGFITRDGVSPSLWLAKAHRDLSRYTSVQIRKCRVIDAVPVEDGFRLVLENCPDVLYCRKLLLATGVTDVLPPIAGIDSFFGKSIFHCPYCDGYELAVKTLMAYGVGESGRQIALELLGWSDDVVLATGEPNSLQPDALRQLELCGVRVVQTKIESLQGHDGKLQSVRFMDGSSVRCDAMFFKTNFFEKSLLAEKLGCNMTDKGLYDTEKFESTNIPGLFVAGDASDSLHLVVEAAASGAEAAFAINIQLIKDEIARRLKRSAA